MLTCLNLDFISGKSIEFKFISTEMRFNIRRNKINSLIVKIVARLPVSVAVP